MNNQAAQTMPDLQELAQRAIPFLRDEGSNYEDDGNNEPLELARAIEAALAGNPNRDAANPGGCECEKCGRVFIGAEWHVLCGICVDHGVAQPDGSGLRNGDNVPASTPEASPQPQVANPAYTAMLPELPDQDIDTERGDYYSMAAMEAYGRACYAAALSQAAGVVEGWKLVPVIPTKEMIARGDEIIAEDGKRVRPESIYDAMVSAAPAASGGESAASVSERARALLAAEYRAAGFNAAADWIAEADMDAEENDLDRCVIRALEQALTQQRWESNPVAWRYVHVIDGDSGSWQPMENLTPAYRKRLADDGCEFEFAYTGAHTRPDAELPEDIEEVVTSLGDDAAQMLDENDEDERALNMRRAAEIIERLAATTPQPSADAVRELVQRWRDDLKYEDEITAKAHGKFADELESLLGRGGK